MAIRRYPLLRWKDISLPAPLGWKPIHSSLKSKYKQGIIYATNTCYKIFIFLLDIAWQGLLNNKSFQVNYLRTQTFLQKIQITLIVWWENKCFKHILCLQQISFIKFTHIINMGFQFWKGGITWMLFAKFILYL